MQCFWYKWRKKRQYNQGHMLGCVSHSPRLRKSKTLCIVYFLLEAWSSNLRTRICSLLKTVSQSIKYTMYRPTCNLTWAHTKTKESMRDNQALSQKLPPQLRGHSGAWMVELLQGDGVGKRRGISSLQLSSSYFFKSPLLGTMWALWTCTDVANLPVYYLPVDKIITYMILFSAPKICDLLIIITVEMHFLDSPVTVDCRTVGVNKKPCFWEWETERPFWINDYMPSNSCCLKSIW